MTPGSTASHRWRRRYTTCGWRRQDSGPCAGPTSNFKFNSRRGNRIVGGWEVGTILTAQSGRPINSAAGYDAPGTGTFGSPRLNSTGRKPYLPKDQRNANAWFDRAGFYYTAPGTFGNIARNRLIGPSQFIWDLSLLKSIAIREGQRLQLRFEAFNFPNHPVLGSPEAAWGPNPVSPQPAFGRIRSTATPMRQVQFGMKYIF